LFLLSDLAAHIRRQAAHTRSKASARRSIIASLACNGSFNSRYFTLFGSMTVIPEKRLKSPPFSVVRIAGDGQAQQYARINKDVH